MKSVTALLVVGTACACVGCSTITQSENQSLSLTATYRDKPVEATCSLKNDRGNWDAKAPSNVSVRKSGEDLDVTCKQDGMPDGILKAISRAAGSMWGNIVFGGGVGALIDHNKGTGYDYPNRLPVKMGESIVVDKKTEQQQPVQTASQNCSGPENKC